ncbi:hypothetical protein C0993_007778 [Termitomyces sp. T159_Od127]|nr:hypothetical protein C0993_007778 [Termitomyces sp. T159_Od127]
MQSRPVFPPEIFDIILEQIPYSADAESEREDSEYTSTLVNCTLVSSSFRDRGQRRLFDDVNIHLPPFNKGHSTLNHILASSARLRTFVHKLHLAIRPKIAQGQVEFNPALPNLTDLWIIGSSRAQFNWNDVKAYQSSIYTLMRGSTLYRLTIRNVYNFPVSALGNCSQLRELSTNYVKYNDTDFPLSTSPVPQTYLRTIHSSDITFYKLATALVEPSFPLSAARLQKLSLVVPNETTSAALEVILDEAGAFLDDLELTFHSGFEPPRDFLNLPNPAILRNVTFRNRMDDISQVVSFLLQIPEVNKLSSVLIYRSILYSGSIPTQDTEDSSWQQLDEVLTRERHAVQFQRLELRDMFPALNSGRDELEARVSRLLPRLTRSNRVVVSDVDSVDYLPI